jgi:hypothetical protein
MGKVKLNGAAKWIVIALSIAGAIWWVGDTMGAVRADLANVKTDVAELKIDVKSLLRDSSP